VVYSAIFCFSYEELKALSARIWQKPGEADDDADDAGTNFTAAASSNPNTKPAHTNKQDLLATKIQQALIPLPLLKIITHKPAEAQAIKPTKTICIKLFQVPTILTQGIHHQTTLFAGKPPPHSTKNKISCNPPRASKLTVANKAAEIFMSSAVFLDPSQYVTATIAENTTKTKLYVTQ
jgi:hypothetical protein